MCRGPYSTWEGLRRRPGIISRSRVSGPCLGLQVWEPVRCSHAPHMETQRVGALWSRPMGARATPGCSPLLLGEEEPEAPQEGSSEGPGRCNPRWVTKSEHGLGWTFPPCLLHPPAPQSCSWRSSEPGLQLCPQGTPAPAHCFGLQLGFSICAQSYG